MQQKSKLSTDMSRLGSSDSTKMNALAFEVRVKYLLLSSGHVNPLYDPKISVEILEYAPRCVPRRLTVYQYAHVHSCP